MIQSVGKEVEKRKQPIQGALLSRLCSGQPELIPTGPWADGLERTSELSHTRQEEAGCLDTNSCLIC